MERATVLIMLSLFTLLAGMAVAAYELWKAEKAKKDGPTGRIGSGPRQG